MAKETGTSGSGRDVNRNPGQTLQEEAAEFFHQAHVAWAATEEGQTVAKLTPEETQAYFHRKYLDWCEEIGIDPVTGESIATETKPTLTTTELIADIHTMDQREVLLDGESDRKKDEPLTLSDILDTLTVVHEMAAQESGKPIDRADALVAAFEDVDRILAKEYGEPDPAKAIPETPPETPVGE
jgi:hypothetical protein